MWKKRKNILHGAQIGLFPYTFISLPFGNGEKYHPLNLSHNLLWTCGPSPFVFVFLRLLDFFVFNRGIYRLHEPVSQVVQPVIRLVLVDTFAPFVVCSMYTSWCGVHAHWWCKSHHCLLSEMMSRTRPYQFQNWLNALENGGPPW